jgi:FKBP-type peptidyl-prolyl cis-trans isomerase
VNRRAVASVLAVLVALASGRADDPPAQENGLTDPAATAFAPGAELPLVAPPAFPAAAFSALGSSLVEAAGLSRLGWTQVQIAAFVDGMGATYDGKALPLGSESKESALEASRQLATAVARARQLAGPPAPAALDFPLPAFSIFGASLVQSGHFAELGWTDAQFDAFLSGMRAAFLEVPVPMDPAARQLAADVGRRIAVAEVRARELSSIARDPRERMAGYFKQMRRRLELQISDSGLGYNVEPALPNGVRPRPGDTVVINCQVTGPDGVTKIPQLSAEKMRVKMEELVPGLLEGLQMMTIGNQALFLIPPSLTFGDGSWPEGVPHGAPLVYTVRLLEVLPGDAPR